MGGGSNLLVSDKGVEEVVIKPSLPEGWKIYQEDSLVEVSASTRSSFFAKKISQEGYEGFEFLSTIPGSIGGAIVQNAGCFGGEIQDILYGVYYIEKGEEKFLFKKDLSFCYRYSIFKENPKWVISRALFVLKRGDRKKIEERLEKMRKKRLFLQPRNRRSGGSTFKNPPGKRAWELIDQVGLRGFQYGRARISSKHPNFIENLGGAKAEEIYFLIRLIEEKVKRKFQISLEREVILWGEFPEVDLLPYLKD